MQLGETIATYDVGLALRGETGKFEVTSPTGETYDVSCVTSHCISHPEWPGNAADPKPFLIRKVAERVSLEPKKSVLGSEAHAPMSVRSPFLLDNPNEPAKSSPGGAVAVLPIPEADRVPENVTLDLLYVESDPITQQPSASVCLRSGGQDEAVRAERLTTPCVSFNELDAQIRRLHAQLDEIRVRARKKFYKAHAAAAGA